ncbi:bifunctional ADP-dependent (S)-NAD(P)H-hydrate dehydratase/NAD(P)H-hydrate epimerase [Anaplasma phagocytophilum str. Norway variant2]|uniref:Bifunctional NAD(P)H-hydrate repair enzyme n=1 Tax=Anaplasma phagocytophilum str. Norway variant2 TaxID=1392507 RepID=A0A161IQQ9_ANAPH|nr:NAD(P)H-hydrate dehydratase [Anaplasma phagocytophilum]ANC34248.1 bifunctional ADP-dependent (S)-NAD(P)H-hydrate dehydratase/NAD(P)H-hydrate epimerase [Anaplasma phagocytophilum str. Norway variant2]
MHRILSVNQFRTCEQGSSIAEEELISRAGAAVVQELVSRFPKSPVLVLCGPGNNGKDGAVIANLLRDKGWSVRLLCYRSNIPDGFALEPDGFVLEEPLIIDSIFGIGLSRPLAEDLSSIVQQINASGKFVVSVDIPTGINSDTGEVMGAAIKADLTVTFSCVKFGHVISPGRQHSGVVCVKDIGLEVCDSTVSLNSPALWEKSMARLSYKSHKYNRGYAAICSLGIRSIGAVKLASLAALRTGPGAVAVACEEDEVVLYASTLLSVMYKAHEEIIRDEKVTSILIGPGGELSDASIKNKVLNVLESGDRGYVLDAGALSVFKDCSDILFKSISKKRVVLTPHEGEFERLFPGLKGTVVERARAAATISNAIVVLKGHDTVIASPEGRVVVNNNAPCALATIGSGDVLAGMITGLIATGMNEFDAACCAVWVHGECGKKYRLGLIAEDIISQIPEVLSAL